jgi:hypothetical protein
MHRIPAAAVPVIVADSQATLHATDQALHAHAQLFASMIESTRGSNLPMNITQDLYSRMVAHGGKLVAGRDDLRQIIGRLTAIKNLSDQKEVASGCPNGLPEVREAIFGMAGTSSELEQA